MSLKSFDDFCAKMVNNEPLQRKEILDERQKLVRSKILTQSLTLFGILVSVNTLIMECGLQWCESYFAPVALFIALCYLYYIVRNSSQGSLFGLDGTSSQTYIAWIVLTECVLIPLFKFFNSDEKAGFTVINNGTLSDKFILFLFFIIGASASIVVLVSARRYKKTDKEVQNDNQESRKA